MSKKSILLSLAAAAAMLGATALGATGTMAEPRRDIDGPVVYVTGQGLFYDSIVLATLPAEGPFQKLEFEGPSGLQTEFGPGDLEFVGGRWWVDVNGNGDMDGGDMYFSCPLLGPGRTEP